MKMKKSISLLVILCIAATMLTAAEDFQRKERCRSAFPKPHAQLIKGQKPLQPIHMTESSSMMTAILRFAEQCKAGMKNIVCSGSIRRRESQWEAV